MVPHVRVSLKLVEDIPTINEAGRQVLISTRRRELSSISFYLLDKDLLKIENLIEHRSDFL